MRRLAWIAGIGALAWIGAEGVAGAQVGSIASRAHDLTVEMEFEQATKLLQGAPLQDTAVALELGRVLLYTTDYDNASRVLERADVAHTEEGARLGALARDCARAMAGAFVVHDAEHGVIVRMQDDHDAALVPLLADVAHRAREALARDLGVRLPVPLRIELVRDQFALSAITGLPEEAARTTGTVAVANWGRVAVLTPRASPDGYPWMDTLAHEMTHLAIARGTRDHAPLWFQEGVAKRQETRWRDADPSDDYPSPDSVSAVGFDLGIARTFDNLGPSIAMLPSAEQAMVVFAEVQSFVQFWMQEAGPDALPKVLVAMRDGTGEVDPAIRSVTGKDLASWTELWRKHIAGASRQLPPEVALGASHHPDMAKASKLTRLGRLLLERNHADAASRVLEQAQPLAPTDLRIRAYLARSMVTLKRNDEAWRQLESVGTTISPYAPAFALRGWLQAGRGDAQGARISFQKALAMDPWEPEVACERLDPPQLPADAIRAKLCKAARKWPP